jgi:hypothetical protein
MDWKLIDEFDRLLDSSGNALLEKGEVRKELVAWDLRRQVRLVFHDRQNDEPEDTDLRFAVWVGLKELRDLIEYLESGQRNNVESNEEIRLLIKELRDVQTWLMDYSRAREKD